MMNQQDIFKKIGLILNELQDQYEFLAQNPSQLNELELELFLANANFLSDHVQIVRKINNNPPVKQIQEHAEITEDAADIPSVVTAFSEPLPLEPPVEIPLETPVEKPEVSTLVVETAVFVDTPTESLLIDEAATAQEHIEPIVEPEDHEIFRLDTAPENQFQDELFNLAQEPAKFEFIMNEDSHADKFDFEDQSIDDIFDRPLSKEEERIIAEKQNQVSAVPIQESIPEVVAEEAPILTLNDLLAGKSSNTINVNEANFKAPITDLRQAINLNEKLLYIKDLFNGYNLAYAEAIDLINKMSDFQTADNFLKNNYAIKNNWASKQTTVDQFYELLNQRFPVK